MRLSSAWEGPHRLGRRPSRWHMRGWHSGSMKAQAAGRKQPLFTESDVAELLRPLGA